MIKNILLFLPFVSLTQGYYGWSPGKQFSHPSQYLNKDVGYHHHGLKGLSPVTMPIIQLFGDLTPKQFQPLKEIFTNPNLTKSEIHQQVRQWAVDQGPEKLQQFEELERVFTELKENITQYFDQKYEGLSTEAKNVYDQYKAVYQNENITPLEECQQITDITKNINDPAVFQELVRTFGMLPKCHLRQQNYQKGGFENPFRGPGQFGAPGYGGQPGFRKRGFDGQQGNFLQPYGPNQGFRQVRQVSNDEDPFLEFKLRQVRGKRVGNTRRPVNPASNSEEQVPTAGEPGRKNLILGASVNPIRQKNNQAKDSE